MKANIGSHQMRQVVWMITLLLLLATVGCGGGEKEGEATAPATLRATQPPAGQLSTKPSASQTTPLPGATAAPVQEQEGPVERAADGMAMVYVAAGEFPMGTDESPFSQEKPQHLVTLDGFWIDRVEVNNAQYRLCVDGGVCDEPKTWTDANVDGDEQPALVLWEAAQTYCGWVGGRLPTEAEWEKAARGTDGRTWPWGNEFQPDRANLNGDDDGYEFTAPVGSFPTGASPYGLLDMAGNAAEWVADWYDAETYAHSPAQNPTGPGGGDQKVIRGTIANAGGGPEKCRTIARYPQDPTRWEFGFRCVATEPPAAQEQASPTEPPAASGEGSSPSPATGTVAGLDGLDSYRMRMTMRMPNADGSGWGPDERMEMEWVRQPEASRIVMADASGSVELEMISIGDDTWMKMGDAWMHVGADQGAQAAGTPVDLDSIVEEIRGGMTLVGEETVNDVHCKHYTVDSEFSIEMPDPTAEGPRAVTGHIKGEMWLADESDLPAIVIRSKAETEMVLSGGEPMTMYDERDVYDINVPITIEPPADVTGMPGATEPTAAPESQPATPLPEQPAGAPLETASLEGLDSYRITMTYQAGDGAGSGAQIVYTEEWVREPPARRFTMSVAEGVPATEYVIIGDSAWIKAGGAWMTIPEADVEDADDNLSAFLTPDSDMTLVGEETVNGIPCQHYVADIELTSQSIHHEMWVADQDDLPAVVVRSVYRLELKSGETTMVTDAEVNVTDINAPITIEPPE